MKTKYDCLSSVMFVQLVLYLAVNSLWLQANASGNETDRLTLLKFKELITGDPQGILNSWNDSLPFCKWIGVACGHSHQRVTSLVLQGHKLVGSISPYIGNLSFLRVINLQNNSFHGSIPQKVGNLFRLEQLILNNTLQGEIAVNQTRCSKLRILYLTWNQITGQIPGELGSLVNLEQLRIAANKLTGRIPPSLGNLSSLTIFSMAINNLVGNVPDELGRLTKLASFAVGANQLSGTFPPSMFNISSMVQFSLAENKLTGSLPDNLGLTLPNLQYFGIGGNESSGTIPRSFPNASQLGLIDLGANHFVGKVSTNLGKLKNLFWLQLVFNNLGSNSSGDLDFLTSLTNCSDLQILDFGINQFGGVLPDFVANLSVQLSSFILGENQISGVIPAGLEHLTRLTTLYMNDNLFTGAIPSYFGNFQKLQGLYLQGNMLSGQIPSSIANLTQLSVLNLSRNNLQGSIPSSIQGSQSLYYLNFAENNLSGSISKELVVDLSSLSQTLNLSHNTLTGNLPIEVGDLKSLNSLDASENSLSGKIPDSIGDCTSLEYLSLQGNSFQGIIPSSLASLKGIRRLDLSRNKLTGNIPSDLQKTPFLSYLNLSFNDLEGEVPTGGIFKNASAISLIGNSKLCGSVPELKLLKCPNKVKKKGKLSALKLYLLITGIVVFVFLASAIAVYWIRKSKRISSSALPILDRLIQVSYGDLYQATSGFSSNNFLGSGSFGSVYKGLLNQVERPVAVKVLNLGKNEASKSFKAECKALRNVRHRNLVRVITYCSSIDYKRNDFKALVFEFMENGSLEQWLHPGVNHEGGNPSRNLNLVQRLNIATDVASALHYLDDLCGRPIIHCDLKPGNILLDSDMVAHVSDFGLARLLSTANDVTQSNTSTIGIKGTIGYTAPEYGMGSAASKEGDVYSYGILVLEKFTGRRPTDEMFKDSLNLYDFVKAALLEERVVEVVDPALVPGEVLEGGGGGGGGLDTAEEATVQVGNGNEIDEENNGTNSRRRENQVDNVMNCLVAVLKIGVACTAESARERMKTGDVAREMHSIVRNAFNHNAAAAAAALLLVLPPEMSDELCAHLEVWIWLVACLPACRTCM